MEASPKRILFLTNLPRGAAPGPRFRFLPFLDFLEENGYQCELASLVDERTHELFRQNGRYWAKARQAAHMARSGTSLLLGATRYDAVYLQQDCLWLTEKPLERLMQHEQTAVILDLSELPASTRHRRRLQRALQRADAVLAGNNFLANYARKFTRKVQVVPPVIDLRSYRYEAVGRPADRVCIGWLGLSAQTDDLRTVFPALMRLRQRYGERVFFVFAGQEEAYLPDMDVHIQPLDGFRDLASLFSIDIGIAPLKSDEASKGKCAYEALQFMALARPVVAQDYGAHRQLIEDGHDGYLAKTPDDWLEKLSALVDSESLRRSLGETALHTVMDRYSTEAQRRHFLAALQQAGAPRQESARPGPARQRL